MSEYQTLKVPELKELLKKRNLNATGNKADLVARLEENDASAAAPAAPAEPQKPAETKEDEITYSDDEGSKPAAPAAAPAPAAPAPTNGSEAKPAEAAAPDAAPAGEKPAEEKKEPVSYAMGLSDTSAEQEAKKRADRAKRFGIEEDDESKKKAERAERFGIDQKDIASGLDSALPERPLKRGRGRDVGEGARPGKRQSLDRRGGGRRRGGGGGGGGGGRREGGDAPVKKSIMDDPAEKAKAEKRAARFAAA